MAVIWDELSRVDLRVMAPAKTPVWQELGDRILGLSTPPLAPQWEELGVMALTVALPSVPSVTWELLGTSQILLGEADTVWEKLGEVLFELRPGEPGAPVAPTWQELAEVTHEVSILGLPGPRDEIPEEGKKINWWLWGGVALLVIAIIIAIVAARRQ